MEERKYGRKQIGDVDVVELGADRIVQLVVHQRVVQLALTLHDPLHCHSLFPLAPTLQLRAVLKLPQLLLRVLDLLPQPLVRSPLLPHLLLRRAQRQLALAPLPHVRLPQLRQLLAVLAHHRGDVDRVLQRVEQLLLLRAVLLEVLRGARGERVPALLGRFVAEEIVHPGSGDEVEVQRGLERRGLGVGSGKQHEPKSDWAGSSSPMLQSQT